MEQNRKVVELYTDPKVEGAFGPLKQFHAILKDKFGLTISLKEVKELLSKEVPSVTIEKHRNERFERRTYLADYIGTYIHSNTSNNLARFGEFLPI
ncbi:MAG: hypothetical protein GY820_01965 [Gammaproteobacteria bacterium]|nr:hypothetical protein [Gammaproteobacteria bacterium]